jgi:hypothetical protein
MIFVCYPLRALVLFLLSLGLLQPTQAQTTPADTLSEAAGWFNRAVVSLNIAQSAYVNWTEGGVNAMSATAATSGQFARVIGGLKQVHDVRLAFGVLQQDTLEVRKAADVIRYALAVQHTGFGPWQPTLATELRTQFAAGFDYNPNPDRYPSLQHRIVRGERLKVSDLFAPAFWTQSIGLSYDASSWYRVRAGVGLKETIVMIPRLRPVYGNAPDQPVRVEAGLDALVEASGEPVENVLVRSRLSLFQAFTDVAETAPDAIWENVVQMRVNRWLSVNLEAVAMYDRDVSERIQLKEVLSLGLSVTLL